MILVQYDTQMKLIDGYYKSLCTLQTVVSPTVGQISSPQTKVTQVPGSSKSEEPQSWLVVFRSLSETRLIVHRSSSVTPAGSHTQPHICTQPTPLSRSSTYTPHTHTHTHAPAPAILCTKSHKPRIVPVAALDPHTTSQISHGPKPIADITTENALRLIGALPSTPLTMEDERRRPCTRMQWPFSACLTPIPYPFPK